MLHFFKLLFFLIDIDQKTVLNWFGVKDPDFELEQFLGSGNEFNSSSTMEPVSFETVRLILDGLWYKIQDGLTLADIENVLFYILFIRFLILAIRYNLKTSFYITCIGLFAGYLWYRHLIDLVSMYRNVLLNIPFLNKLGMDILQLRQMKRQMYITRLKLGENCHWYNPGQVLYYAFKNGIMDIDIETGFRYYIDPISMIISKIQNPAHSGIVSVYYKLYHQIIPKIFDTCTTFWSQISGVSAYAIITRVGKKYCPYLIRWHWTFLLIIGLIEPTITYLIYRIYYFQTFVLVPEMEELEEKYGGLYQSNLKLQMYGLNSVIVCIVLAHIGFVLFGLFHAIWGQYFYFPFFVENTELHIGPRPKNSIYSGGNTAWQDPEEKEKSLKRIVPKLWYGWFGNGTKNRWKWVSLIFKAFNFIFKAFKQRFRS